MNEKCFNVLRCAQRQCCAAARTRRFSLHQTRCAAAHQPSPPPPQEEAGNCRRCTPAAAAAAAATAANRHAGGHDAGGALPRAHVRTRPAKPAAHAQPSSFHLQDLASLLPASYLLVGGSRQVWCAEVEKAPFYVANAEARRAFVTLVDYRIAGGAHPDAVPRGSAAAVRAEGLVKSIATEYQLDCDFIAGGCRSAVQWCMGAPVSALCLQACVQCHTSKALTLPIPRPSRSTDAQRASMLANLAAAGADAERLDALIKDYGRLHKVCCLLVV